MNYRVANENDFDAIYGLVQNTIKTSYKNYYVRDVIDFFCEHHSKDSVMADIQAQKTFVLEIQNQILATVTLDDNHINRFFVNPEFQGKGYGSFVLSNVEKQIAQHFDHVLLDASLASVCLYEKKGYKTVSHEKEPCENGIFLVYEIMRKDLPKNETAINFDGKFFVVEQNSKNGEVGGETVFSYHQNQKMLWAEYSGGDIKKGFLLGVVNDDNSLDFNYEHINLSGDFKKGKCHSTPQILPNGKIKLFEKWQWQTGDLSHGDSVLIEQ